VPHFKRLVFLKVPEPATRMAMLRAGSMDVIEIGGTDPWATPELLKPYPYDPAKAKALLAEAGYPKGFDVTMNLTAWPGR
jgi:ABC-type transport system substrate-binding protein